MEVFEQHDYVAVDAIRPEIWSNPEVEWWYAQNLLMFVHEPHLASTAALVPAHDRTKTGQLSMVHPREYLELIRWYTEEYRRLRATNHGGERT